MTLDSALDRVSSMLGVTLEWMEIRDFYRNMPTQS